MNKITLSFLVIFLITTLLINQQIFKDSQSLKTESQNQMFLLKPNWKISSTSSNSIYKIECDKAEQLNSNGTFLLVSPLLRSTSKEKQNSLISSQEAILKISERILTMKEKVSIKLNNEEETLNLITEILNLNLRNNIAFSSGDVEMFSQFFSLKSKGFEMKEDSDGVFFMTFKKAKLKQSKEQGYKKFGSADMLQIKGSSDILILRGSANIALNKTIMYADEIIYNFKTKSIIGSVNPRIVNNV